MTSFTPAAATPTLQEVCDEGNLCDEIKIGDATDYTQIKLNATAPEMTMVHGTSGNNTSFTNSVGDLVIEAAASQEIRSVSDIRLNGGLKLRLANSAGSAFTDFTADTTTANLTIDSPGTISAENLDVGAGNVFALPRDPDAIGQGTWALIGSGSQINGYLYNTTHADGDNCSFNVFLAKGTYTL